MSEPTEPCFTLTIDKRTGSFGESAHSESDEVARLLRAAAHAIGSGVPIDKPEQRELKCRSGIVVAHFEFGPGMIRGPGPGFDAKHFRTPSALEVANQPRRA
jgi:hypothetical protein